jgi:signal transduction histidine kinase
MGESQTPRVLLVDDEPDFLEMLSRRLRLRGLDVLTAEGGHEALAVVASERVGVVVLDVRMAPMDGIETLRRIKELKPLTEVILLTGHADLQSSLEGMRFGFFDYLTKPVQLPTLIEKIKAAERRRMGEPTSSTTFETKLQEHMMVADRLSSLGELAASIAHEINNPLAIIVESSGWLRSRFEHSESNVEDLRRAATLALGKIDAAADRAARISRNFLRFARAPDARVSDVDLPALADEIVDLTRGLAGDRQAEFSVHLESGRDARVATDPFQLRQVLLNLATNALQAIDQGGHVRIVVGRRGDDVTIAVEDDGPGIPADDLERIFEPFFTTKEEGQGTGLGLAVSRGIIEKLGGRIEVEPSSGKGATFTVVLPRQR